MGGSVEITQEQSDLLEASVQTALDLLLETGNFLPSLYVHDGQQMAVYALSMGDQGELRRVAGAVLRERAPNAIAYALLFDSALETDAGTIDALIVETGNSDDKEAHEFARRYTRADKTTSSRLARLGPAPNLLAAI